MRLNRFKKMYRCCLLSFLLLVFGCTAFAQVQERKIDSLNALLSNNPDVLKRIEVHGLLGFEYWTVDAKQSIAHADEALLLASEIGDTTGMAFGHRVKGVAFWVLGDNSAALKTLLESLKLYEQLQDPQGKANVLMNMGLIYADGLNLRLAKQQYREANAIFEKLGLESRIATTNIKIASVLIDQDSLSLAEDILNTAIDIHTRDKFRYGLTEAYNRMGVLQQKKGNYKASLDYFFRSREISLQISDNEGLAKTYNEMAASYLELRDIPRAEEYYLLALDQSYKIHSKKYRLISLKGLFEVSLRKNELQKAIAFITEHEELQDSIQNQEKLLAIANLQNEFENSERIRQLEASELKVYQLEQESKIKRTQIIFISSTFGLGLILFFMVYRMQKARSKQARQEHEKDMQLAHSEKALRESEMENARLREEELKKELELKKRELTSYALNFVQKNEFINEIKSDLLQEGKNPVAQEVRKKIQQLSRTEQDWEAFKKQFESIHSEFLKALQKKHPQLSQGEVRHCILIHMNMNTKECAAVLNISPQSAKTSRYRLRKKLGLEHDASLYAYLISLG